MFVCNFIFWIYYKQMIFCIIPLQIFILLLVNTSASSYRQFLASTPEKFGLLTVTHVRNGQYSYFARHIDTYASMQCPEISQISIVWNNDVPPEQAGFTENQKWKRPVYFLKTPFNSMDFRYLLPKQSQASVFFSMDDDVLISCQQMVRSFQIWRTKAIGDIAPLMSYGPRGFNFSPKGQNFIYTDPLDARFYSISLIGICWVSRFFLELYNTQKLWEIKAMRSIVQEKNNCDDIALNYLISLLFPQLIPINVVGPFQMKRQPQSQGLKKNHYPYRNQCLNQFTQIIGFNPLKITNRQQKDISKLGFDENGKYILYLKRKYLKQKLLSSQSSLQKLLENTDDLQLLMNQERQQKKQESNVGDNQSFRKQQLRELIRSAKSDKQQLSKELQLLIKSSNGQTNIQSHKQQNTKKDSAQKQREESQNQKKVGKVQLTFEYIMLMSFFGIIFVCAMLILFCKICLQSNTKGNIEEDNRKKNQKFQNIQKQEIRVQSDD